MDSLNHDNQAVVTDAFICDSSVLIHHGVYHNSFVCPW